LNVLLKIEKIEDFIAKEKSIALSD